MILLYLARSFWLFIGAVLLLAILASWSIFLAGVVVIMFGTVGLLAFIDGFVEGVRERPRPKHKGRRKDKAKGHHRGTRKYGKAKTVQKTKH